MGINEAHEQIIKILRKKGPSLPIQISKEVGISSLFVSAFLSELAGEKRIKISHLKVGGSPLYFLDGQQEKLEKFYKFLHPKEAETFLLLKKKKVLRDSEQEPSIRVALRRIRDFAMGFKKGDEIFWKYFSVSETETRKILSKIKKTKPKTKPQKPIMPTIKPIRRAIKKQIIQRQIITTKPEKPKKEKAKSQFIAKITEVLARNFKILEQKDYKAKEYNCIIQVQSNLGPINFLTQAKHKKTISEADLKKLVSNAQSISLPAFMVYTGKLGKKAQEYAEKYSSILKTKKLG